MLVVVGIVGDVDVGGGGVPIFALLCRCTFAVDVESVVVLNWLRVFLCCLLVCIQKCGSFC